MKTKTEPQPLNDICYTENQEIIDLYVTGRNNQDLTKAQVKRFFMILQIMNGSRNVGVIKILSKHMLSEFRHEKEDGIYSVSIKEGLRLFFCEDRMMFNILEIRMDDSQ